MISNHVLCLVSWLILITLILFHKNIEHRYYGKSFPNETAGDYSFLSSRQAVRDIIAFVQSSEVQQLITTRGRRSASDIDATTLEQGIKIPASLSSSSSSTSTIFITFGGSYPGMLAAWSRLLHPEIIFAAVSNSAPIQAQLQFPEYYERVGYDLENEDIGGSAECRSIVEEGHAQVAAILERGEQNNSSSPSSQRSGDDDGDLIREYDLDRVATLFNVCGGSEMLRASRRNLEVSTMHFACFLLYYRILLNATLTSCIFAVICR